MLYTFVCTLVEHKITCIPQTHVFRTYKVMSSTDYSFSGVQNEIVAKKVAFVLHFIHFDVWVLTADIHGYYMSLKIQFIK